MPRWLRVDEQVVGREGQREEGFGVAPGVAGRVSRRGGIARRMNSRARNSQVRLRGLIRIVNRAHL